MKKDNREREFVYDSNSIKKDCIKNIDYIKICFVE